ncbi:MAG TPA: sigma-70 family RNA polymerase sigma factor [Gemmatimonadaceae bacterium]|nr:sigma-70 family RNA polymerase sigma factor [Gemmatimonadaceae bacterium]
MTPIDARFADVREGDHAAFEAWLSLVEPSLRASLRTFARGVDVEAVLQEGLTRMWVLAPRLELTGENASLRYAAILVRNLARHEARRLGFFVTLDPDPEGHAPPEPSVPPGPVPDPGLRRAIDECLEKLPPQPRRALTARLASGGALADRDLADRCGMSTNTFLQNVVRARRSMATCLEGKGVHLAGVRT